MRITSQHILNGGGGISHVRFGGSYLFSNGYVGTSTCSIEEIWYEEMISICVNFGNSQLNWIRCETKETHDIIWRVSPSEVRNFDNMSWHMMCFQRHHGVWSKMWSSSRWTKTKSNPTDIYQVKTHTLQFRTKLYLVSSVSAGRTRAPSPTTTVSLKERLLC